MHPDTLERRAVKTRARDTLRRMAAPCLAAAASVLAVGFAAMLLQHYTGGLVFPGLLDAAEFPARTGLWSISPALMTELGLADFAARGGLLAALRVEAAGAVMVYILPWAQLVPFFVTMALVFLVSTPIRYGALSHLWRVAEEHPAPPAALFRFYLDLRLTGKALAAELVLGLWSWLAQLLCMAPALLFMVRFAQESGDSPIWLVVLLLMVAGLLLGFWLSLLLVPVRFLLARAPELGLREAFSRGVRVFRGKRKQFFWLSLSFVPWQLVSMISYGVADLFLFPYQNLAYIYFLLNAEGAERTENGEDRLSRLMGT